MLSDRKKQAEWFGKVYKVKSWKCEVVNVIAEGGFAIIFDVLVQSGRHYALKRQLTNDVKALESAKMEVSIMKAFKNNKNFVPFVDHEINLLGDGIHEILILMEKCSGPDIYRLMNKRHDHRLTLLEINKIFTDICLAVASLHHHNPPITHRDIKVENILSHEGRFVLCDFGSATTKTFNLQNSQPEELKEEIQQYTTIPYRSPEMIDIYNGKWISCKSDIWALGCVLYILFHFSTPFGECQSSIINNNLNFPPEKNCPPEYQELIRFILNPDPDKRPYISEVCEAAFVLAKIPCNVPPEPPHALVPVSVTTPLFSVQPLTPKSSPKVAPQLVETSYAPRSRPKASHAYSPSSITSSIIGDPVDNMCRLSQPLVQSRHRRSQSDGHFINSSSSNVINLQISTDSSNQNLSNFKMEPSLLEVKTPPFQRSHHMSDVLETELFNCNFQPNERDSKLSINSYNPFLDDGKLTKGLSVSNQPTGLFISSVDTSDNTKQPKRSSPDFIFGRNTSNNGKNVFGTRK